MREKLIHGESGSALVELAIFLPVLTLLFVGVVDYGLEIQQKMQVAEAAGAGASYGTVHGNSKDFVGMQRAAMNSASHVPGLTVSAANIFTCTPGGAQVTSGSICPGYGTPIEYVQVQASAAVPTMLAFPGMPTSLTLQQTATYRVPWSP